MDGLRLTVIVDCDHEAGVDGFQDLQLYRCLRFDYGTVTHELVTIIFSLDALLTSARDSVLLHSTNPFGQGLDRPYQRFPP